MTARKKRRATGRQGPPPASEPGTEPKAAQPVDAVGDAVHAVLHDSPLLKRIQPAGKKVAKPAPAVAVEPAATPATVVEAQSSGQAVREIVRRETAVAAGIAAPARTPDSAQTAAAPSTEAPSAPDLEALATNMSQLMDQSRHVAEAYLKAAETAPKPAYREEMSDAVATLGKIAEHWLGEPGRLVQAQASLSAKMLGLWAESLQRLSDPKAATPAAPEPRPTDKRFADPEWRDNPIFDFVRKAYLAGTSWANDLVDQADNVDEATRDKARFYLRQISSAVSPSNFVATNPELLRETLAQNGGNLVRGMRMLAADVAAGQGGLRIRQTDTSKFELGVNMALSPGKVVFRNDLIELLQYAPTTETVLKRPLLIVPPWINKFYVLDLNPEKSFIRWAVAQGMTVFVVSWVNPDERHADKGFGAYMCEGIVAALDAIEAATGEREATAIGYCVGGTLLAVTLAHMAAMGEHRISSATLFTTQVDFRHAGDLKVFADTSQIAAIEASMRQTGYLDGAKMAQAFNMLRPEELIWSYVVNNYLKGKDPVPFDLLAWNADSTRMPAANHSFYLRNCYLENRLTRGELELEGVRLDLGRVTIPIYNLATRDDHIAPALSVFEGSRFFGGPVRFVLAGSGHIAGVVSPPAKAKYGFWLGPEPNGAFDDWLAAATHQAGSWWPDWFAWIEAQAPERVPAREPGSGRLEILGDAPGTYVKVRA